MGTESRSAHIDHSIGGDSEERGTLVDSLEFVGAVAGATQVLKLAEGALQSSTVLANELVAGVEVVQLTGEGVEGPLGRVSVLLRHGTLVS